jgi:hypothetical protein
MIIYDLIERSFSGPSATPESHFVGSLPLILLMIGQHPKGHDDVRRNHRSHLPRWLWAPQPRIVLKGETDPRDVTKHREVEQDQPQVHLKIHG